MLSRLVITFLLRRKRLLISWLQSPSAVTLEPKKIKSLTISPSICHEEMEPDAMILVFWMLSFTLQYCSGFCHTLTRISHGCTCVPHPEPPSQLPPHPIPLGHPSAPALSTLSHASNLDWWSVSHMTIHMFQCYSLKSPTLAFYYRDQKTVLYMCVSFAVSHIG